MKEHVPIFIDKYELFETTNPALMKVNTVLAAIGPIDEQDFLRNVDKVVDGVMEYFEMKRGTGNGEGRKAVPPEHTTTQPPVPSFQEEGKR